MTLGDLQAYTALDIAIPYSGAPRDDPTKVCRLRMMSCADDAARLIFVYRISPASDQARCARAAKCRLSPWLCLSPLTCRIIFALTGELSSDRCSIDANGSP